VQEHIERAGEGLFGGRFHSRRPEHRDSAATLLPFLPGPASAGNRRFGSFSDAPEVLRFVNSGVPPGLALLGTTCPDHFVRTKIRPLFVPWNPESEDIDKLRSALDDALREYRREYAEYYRAHARADSPPMRDPNPTVALIPGVGMFSFGKSKAEAR